MREAKQVLVVRKDLKMRKGKIAAQCAHASMKVLLDRMWTWDTRLVLEGGFNADGARILGLTDGSALKSWIEGSFAKICVYVNSEEELDEIYAKAQDANLMCSLIVDHGRTEFHGVHTKTVVAIGPAWVDEIDPVTGHLPLL